MKKFLIKVNGSQYEVEVEEVGGSAIKETQTAIAASTCTIRCKCTQGQGITSKNRYRRTRRCHDN